MIRGRRRTNAATANAMISPSDTIHSSSKRRSSFGSAGVIPRIAWLIRISFKRNSTVPLAFPLSLLGR